MTDRQKLLQVIQEEHLKNNHRGIGEVFLELKKYYYFPKFQKEIQKYVNNCEICSLAKYDRVPIKHSLNVTFTPETHNEVVHVDIWFPQRGVMYLTSIDKLTKYATASYLEDRTWISLIKALKERIQYLGKPKQLIIDNELDTIAVREFLKEQKIYIHTKTAYLKIGNADVERLHGTLNEHIRLFHADPENKDNISEQVFKAIVSYNNTIHSATKNRPIDLINNLISKEELSKLSKLMHAEKTKKVEMLNKKSKKVSTENFANEIVKNYRVSKSKPKYKKVANYVQEGNYLISKDENKKKYTKHK